MGNCCSTQHTDDVVGAEVPRPRLSLSPSALSDEESHTTIHAVSPTGDSQATGPQPRRFSKANSVLDPQTFEFVDALHLPRDSPQPSLSQPREKRNSITSWFTGGLFSASRSRVDSPVSSRSNSTRPSRHIKMLMSGAGESGKSTVIKQMKIIHHGGFTPEEVRDFMPQIYRNIQDAMMQVLDSMDYVELTRNDMVLINRIALPDFVPTNDDILRARIQTTGINEFSFRSGPLHIKMIDVGGQRPERRKWIETFDNVTTVIFCVALSEYDQMLLEEPRQNRLLESFQLWESVVNSKWFQKSSIVLFLNKRDIFRTKLRSNPLQRYFPEYRPPEGASEEQQYEHATEFLKNKFLSMNYGRVQIYPHLTCATDTKNIDMVFADVKDTILANNLRSAGIL